MTPWRAATDSTWLDTGAGDESPAPTAGLTFGFK